MRVSPITDNRNNPNFGKLIASRSTLKKLGTTKKELLRNEFLSKWSNIYDIHLQEDFGIGSQFLMRIGRGCSTSWFSKVTTFKETLIDFVRFDNKQELENKTIDNIKPELFKKHSYKKYKEIYKIFESLKHEEVNKFLQQWNYILLYIASIPNEPEYKETNEYFLSVLKELKFWRPLPKKDKNIPTINSEFWENTNLDTEKSAGLRALESNNLELLKFLKEKGENLNQCLDLMKQGKVSEEAKEILKDVKRQDAVIFELENIFEFDSDVNKFLENNPNIDINSRNREGDTLMLRAATYGNLRLLNFLRTRDEIKDEVNWNAYDAYGSNAAFLALTRRNHEILELLKHLPEGKFDFSNKSLLVHRDHYTLTFELTTPLKYALQEEEQFLGTLLDVKEYKRTNIIEYVNAYGSDYAKGLVDNNLDKFILEEAQILYDRNGMLTLEEIYEVTQQLMDTKRLNNLKFATFNIANDTLGHLLADNPIDPNNAEQMELAGKIISNLQSNKLGNCLLTENYIGQTPLTKALEGENIGLIKLLVETPSFTPEALRMLKESKNPEIQKIYKEIV